MQSAEGREEEEEEGAVSGERNGTRGRQAPVLSLKAHAQSMLGGI